MMDFSFLHDEDTPFEDVVKGYQDLIDSGMAWRLEGHVGRTAHQLIIDGYCTLGEESRRDFYGSYVPSKHEIERGKPGSVQYVLDRTVERAERE